MFADLFDRLATRLRLVNLTIKEHGSHFGTLPNVTALAPSNFRGQTAQRISSINSLLSKFVFSGRTKFFHKLNSLEEIIEQLQAQTRGIVNETPGHSSTSTDRAWKELEILGYDLNTCLGESTVMLKSFFCALPNDELEPFRRKLVTKVPALLPKDSRLSQPMESD